MIAIRQTRQAKRRALEKLSHQINAGNSKPCEAEVHFPIGARR